MASLPAVPSLQQLASGLPDEVQRTLRAALSAQDTFNRAVADRLNTAFAWTNVTSFQNGWSNYLTFVARYTKLANGLVVLDGVVSGGTLVTSAFTLPQGCRPGQGSNLPQVANAAFALLYVDPSGAVQPTTGSNVWFSLSGTCFMAGG